MEAGVGSFAGLKFDLTTPANQRYADHAARHRQDEKAALVAPSDGKEDQIDVEANVHRCVAKAHSRVDQRDHYRWHNGGSV